jgi:hypothetical protein
MIGLITDTSSSSANYKCNDANCHFNKYIPCSDHQMVLHPGLLFEPMASKFGLMRCDSSKRRKQCEGNGESA